MAYLQGTYTMTDPMTKKPMTDKGKYLTVFTKQPDGSWKAIADAFNSDPPMTLTSKIFFVCKDFQGVYAATAVSWAVTGLSWATVERNALRIATMILRPLEVSW